MIKIGHVADIKNNTQIPESIKSDVIDIKNEYYGTWSKGEEKPMFSPIGKAFYIDKIECNFEDESIYLSFKSNYGDKVIRHTLSRSKLNYIGMSELANNGFDVKNLEVFQALVPKLEEMYFKDHDISSFHQGIGWDKSDDSSYKKELFAGSGDCVYKRYDYIDNIPSRYNGIFDIKPRGSLEEQLKFIKKEVQGNIPCEMAVALGLSAVVNGRIRDIVHTSNLIIHLYGDSSRGKTTAAQLAISVAGIPDLQKTSLMMSWNSTSNAIVSRLKMNRGMPVAMDEISKFSGNDLTGLIYALSDGRDKERLNKDASLKSIDKNESFATTIISTGEATITGKCKNNTGIKARVIEIDTQFTNSAEHSNIIKKGCFENCGHLAPKLAEFMQEKGIDYIVDRHKYWMERYMEKTTVSALKERVSANYAVVLLAAEMANFAFRFTFDVEGILDFFVENEKETSGERNIAFEVYEKLIDYALSNRGHFIRHNHKKNNLPFSETSANDNIEILGRIEECINKKFDDTKTIVNEYCFTREGFKKIVTKLGYEDDMVLLKKLKQAGLLNHEEGKLYRKRKLCQDDCHPTNMYVLYEFEQTPTSFDDFVDISATDVENPFEKK
ncbi:MAG: DUF927 domain-containing protein [Clostridia bacterium]|nr:DUF927 domain-containing protein [Clostridia bacterium]